MSFPGASMLGMNYPQTGLSMHLKQIMCRKKPDMKRQFTAQALARASIYNHSLKLCADVTEFEMDYTLRPYRHQNVVQHSSYLVEPHPASI